MKKYQRTIERSILQTDALYDDELVRLLNDFGCYAVDSAEQLLTVPPKKP